MPDIVSPQAILFANQKCRILADSMLTCYLSAKEFKLSWDAVSMGTLIPNTADNVADGSDVDGRQRLTGTKANSLYTAAGAIITWFETGSPSRADQLRAMAVNAQSRV